MPAENVENFIEFPSSSSISWLQTLLISALVIIFVNRWQDFSFEFLFIDFISFKFIYVSNVINTIKDIYIYIYFTLGKIKLNIFPLLAIKTFFWVKQSKPIYKQTECWEGVVLPGMDHY